MVLSVFTALTHIPFTSTKISDFHANVDILDEIHPEQD